MRPNSIRRSTGAAVLALSLLAAGFVAPALRHAHPQVDRTHRPAMAGRMTHSHSHAAGRSHADHHHRHAVPRTASGEVYLDGVTAHVHVTWFGWELTLPAPADSRPLDPYCDTGFGPAVGVLVRIGNDQPVVNGPAALAWTWFMPAPAAEPMLTDRGSAESVRRSASMAIAAPLCDTARHERSGVQLI
jgi:hypothetical protein